MTYPDRARLWASRRARAVVLSAFVACAGVSAQAAEPVFAPGYCPAPEAHAAEKTDLAWGEFSILNAGRSVQTAVFVDCAELGEWRRGERERFSIYGAVTLYQGAALVAESFPGLAEHVKFGAPAAPSDDVEAVSYRPAATRGPRGFLRDRIDDGMQFRTRMLETGAILPAEPAAAAEGGETAADRPTLHLSGATLSEDGEAAIERTLVAPYRDEDGLRYLQAAMLAAVSADRLTLLQLP